MKTINLLMLMLITIVTFKAEAHFDYKIYRDNLGMPRCLESNLKDSNLIIFWDNFAHHNNRKIFYRKFDGAQFKNVCKKWPSYDSTLLRLDATLIEFQNGIAPNYLEEFTLTPKIKLALEQIEEGYNRFLAKEAFSDKKFLKEIFEPFKMETHDYLISEVGVTNTTELYHSYSKSIGITKDCAKYVGTCEYYLCREQNKTCGAEGYFLGFGYQYCSDSLKRLINEVSPVGKKWLQTTATCLHQQMEEVKDKNSCDEIKKQAIKSHDKCYSEVSFCSLKFSDMLKILKMIHPALTEHGVMTEGIQVLGHCTGV
jgi:hypothetical protein